LATFFIADALFTEAPPNLNTFIVQEIVRCKGKEEKGKMEEWKNGKMEDMKVSSKFFDQFFFKNFNFHQIQIYLWKISNFERLTAIE
jgi:hypothetical protein